MDENVEMPVKGYWVVCDLFEEWMFGESWVGSSKRSEKFKTSKYVKQCMEMAEASMVF